jgi:predicted RNA-binding protein with PIN domain
MPLIIDGHNLLWAVQKPFGSGSAGPAAPDGAGEETESISDVQLCRIVGTYLKQTGESGEIIFDGIGPTDKSGFDNIATLQVLFVGRATDADTVIEEKIRASTAPRRLTVVSSDRRLRKAAQTRKATAVKSEVFWDDVQKLLSRKKAAKEPPEKRLGLTESETKLWLEIFGLEQ